MIRRLVDRARFMREHRWTQRHLSEYLDEELDGSERARVEAHEGICPQCGRMLATLRRTLEGLRSLGGEGERGVAEGVIQRLRHES